MCQCDAAIDLKINVGHRDLKSSDFAFLYLCTQKRFWFYWQSVIQVSYAVLRQLLFAVVAAMHYPNKCLSFKIDLGTVS